MKTYEDIEEKIAKFKYTLTVNVIYSDDDIETVHPDNVVSLSVEHNFVDNLFPITKLQISLSERSYYKILDNRNTIKVKLLLESSPVNQVDDIENDEIFFRRVLDCTMKPIIDKITPYKTKNLDSSDLEEENTDNMAEDTNEFNIMNLYLFKEDELNINKSLFNFIAEDCSVLDAIGYVVNQAGVKNLLISPPNNNTVYKQIIVPPSNYKECLLHLQKYYGIYNTNIVNYFDHDKTYILSRDVNNCPYTEEEPSIIYVYINSLDDADIQYNYGMYRDELDRKEYICIPNYAQFKTHMQKNAEIVGDEITILDQNKMENNAVVYDAESKTFKFNDHKIVMNKGNDNSSNTRNRIYTNSLSSASANTEFEFNYDKSELEVIIPFVDININNFTPNRKFILIFREAELNYKYSGEYYLDKINYNLSKSNDSYLSLHATCLFKKA